MFLQLGLRIIEDPPAPPPDPGGGYGWFLLETLLILGAVCALAWIVIRVGVRKLYPAGVAGAGGRNGALRVVARLPLEPRRTVYILEAAGKTLLVGVSEGGSMTTLAELDPQAVAAAAAAAPRQKSFLELLKRKTAGSGGDP